MEGDSKWKEIDAPLEWYVWVVVVVMGGDLSLIYLSVKELKEMDSDSRRMRSGQEFCFFTISYFIIVSSLYSVTPLYLTSNLVLKPLGGADKGRCTYFTLPRT